MKNLIITSLLILSCCTTSNLKNESTSPKAEIYVLPRHLQSYTTMHADDIKSDSRVIKMDIKNNGLLDYIDKNRNCNTRTDTSSILIDNRILIEINYKNKTPLSISLTGGSIITVNNSEAHCLEYNEVIKLINNYLPQNYGW